LGPLFDRTRRIPNALEQCIAEGDAKMENFEMLVSTETGRCALMERVDVKRQA
jgi:hypothetical protein